MTESTVKIVNRPINREYTQEIVKKAERPVRVEITGAQHVGELSSVKIHKKPISGSR